MEYGLIVLGIMGLFLFLMRRGGAGLGCCGGGHSHGGPSGDSKERTKGTPRQSVGEKKPV